MKIKPAIWLAVLLLAASACSFAAPAGITATATLFDGAGNAMRIQCVPHAGTPDAAQEETFGGLNEQALRQREERLKHIRELSADYLAAVKRGGKGETT